MHMNNGNGLKKIAVILIAAIGVAGYVEMDRNQVVDHEQSKKIV